MRLIQVIPSKHLFFNVPIHLLSSPPCSFKRTKNMNALLEERARRQQGLQAMQYDSTPIETPIGIGEKKLKTLVESVKRKSVTTDLSGMGKRRRV